MDLNNEETEKDYIAKKMLTISRRDTRQGAKGKWIWNLDQTVIAIPFTNSVNISFFNDILPIYVKT